MQLPANLLRYKATIALAVANVAVYVVIACGASGDLFALSGSLSVLAVRPWTLVTFMFAQAELGHLLINLVVLALAGYYYEKITSSSRLGAVYLLGGLAGGLVFVFVCVIAGAEVPLMGSSSAALAVWAAIIADRVRPMADMILYPFGRVRPMWILAVYVVICIIGLFGGNPGGNIAHLAGIVSGVVAGKTRSLVVKPRKKNPLVRKAEQSGFASLTDEERRKLFEQYSKTGK